jgi:PAS domain S-box-containing protein
VDRELQPTRSSNISVLLEPILRGAAKILGCATATLILLNERTRTARLRIGHGELTPIREAESIFGSKVADITVPFGAAEDSLVFKVWRGGMVIETSSVGDLIGSAFPPEQVTQLVNLIGAHRFMCVPVASRSRRFGAIIFEKEGAQSYSRQQRELGVRYASRIGETVENDLWAEGEALLSDAGALPTEGDPTYLLFDPVGAVVGRGGQGAEEGKAADGVEGLPPEFVSELRSRAVRLLRGEGPGRSCAPVEIGVGGTAGLGQRRLWAELVPLPVDGRKLALCRVWEPHRSIESSVENVLLQFAVGEAAPSLFLDTDFRITSCNRATEELFGLSLGEIRGRPVSVLFHAPDDILRLLNHQLLLGAGGYGEETAPIRPRNGSLVPARIEAVLLADQGARPAGFLVLIRPRPEADATADSLMRRERLATMGEMAAQLAHELRNPLVAIGATLEGLGGELRENVEAGRILADVSREIVRLDMLLKDYLTLAVRQDALLARVDVSRMLDESCDLLRRTGKLGRRALDVRLAAGTEVLADSEGLRHVFFNLLLNAVEATADGGRILCHGQVAERDVTVYVDDDGPGLSAPSEQCVEPFFTTKENGSGLGLAVCQRIIHAHGGALYLQNREEGGCRAAVVLPRGAR